MSQIAASLRVARDRRGWSREALAFHSGVSWSAIAQIESGRRKDVRLNSLLALARALGVTVDYLVGGERAAAAAMLSHPALVYRTDDEFLAGTAPFLAEGVERGEAALAVTTPPRVKLLRAALGRAATKQVTFADSAGWYATPAGAVRAYRDFLGGRLDQGVPWARVVGEPVWAGRSKAQTTAWARYESLINLVFATVPATIMCPYDAGALPPSVLAHARSTHPVIVEGAARADSQDYRMPEDYLL